MDPRIVKKTQDTLGKIIKKPPLTDKLLSKPPFRFLHDITTSVIKTTGFMNGLYKEEELNSENVKDKDSKIAFLQKAIDFTAMVTGKSLSVKPAKIVAGHEPEKTNEFLQCLATAINKGVDNDEYVAKMNKGGGEPKEEKRDKSKEGSREDRKKRDSEDKKDRDKSASREKSRERHRDKEDRHKDREDRHRDKEDRRRDDEDRHRDKKDRHRDKESRHKDKDEDREDRHRDRKERKKHQDEESKENDPSQMNGEKEESPTKLARPSSAKGSRRRREGRRHSSDEEDEPPKTMMATEGGDDNLPPQVSASRSLARPSSARPAPPRRKQEVMENEPAMRLGSGKPSNVIVDGGRDSEEEEDETFMVEETAAPQEPEQAPPPQQDDDEDEDHGGLVKKMLETKKELESGSQVKKTEIERPKITDAQRMKQRQQVQKEIDKLRVSIQTLTRSANPLGKVMDYVQEDLDSMQKELQRWKQENKEHALELKRERSITDKAIEPLRAQLTEVDQAIKDQLDLIAAVKSNIIRNDQKIDKMLRSIAKS